MNKKPSPLAALAALTPEQAEELYDLLRTMPYRVAVKWCAEKFSVTVSISGLRRWWARESKSRARADLRSAIKASEQFDKHLDARALDARANNALRAAFWQAITSGDKEAVKTFASLSLDYNADARGGADLQLRRDALAVKESQLALAREKFESSEARLASTRDIVADTRLTDAERTAKIKEIFGLA